MLKRFIRIYCREHHSPAKGDLCLDCSHLLSYAEERLEKCPYDPKPKCKDCATHCYKPEYRDRIKEVMRFSGMHRQ